MKVLLLLLMILPFGGCVNSVASAGHILKGNAEDDAKNFLNINDRTSALRFTDGEQIMLPCFSGENNTELYVVYFLGRTEKERSFWDVYNKKGYWKGKDAEQAYRYEKDMERYINARITRYDVFAIALNKEMVKDIKGDEFQPDSNAVYKTYLLTNGKWIQTDSFKVQDAPKDTGEYLMNISGRNNKKFLKCWETVWCLCRTSQIGLMALVLQAGRIVYLIV